MNIQSETWHTVTLMYKIDACCNDLTSLLLDNGIPVNNIISSQEREISLHFQRDRLTIY